MFFILSKILSFFLSPIWWITVLLLAYLIFKKYKRRKLFFMAAISLLLVFSNQLLLFNVSGWWEGELKNPNEIGHYDGIILLGGFSNYQSEAQRMRFMQSGDRLFQAVELYKKGKAQYFIFTGGSGRVLVREKREGEYLKDYLKLLGIPQDSTLVEWKSRNTHENAVETRKMLAVENMGKGKYLLVTSGFHMKRALGCFKKEGIDVVPYTADPLQSSISPDFWDTISPSASALGTWEILFREWVGYAVYKIRGYV